MLIVLIVLAAVFVTLGILAHKGIVSTHAKCALMFVGGGKHARFRACTGTQQLVVRFDESRAYHFTLDAALDKGSISVELLDSARSTVMTLSGSGSAEAAVESGVRYRLIIRLKSATGEYSLDWA